MILTQHLYPHMKNLSQQVLERSDQELKSVLVERAVKEYERNDWL